MSRLSVPGRAGLTPKTSRRGSLEPPRRKSAQRKPLGGRGPGELAHQPDALALPHMGLQPVPGVLIVRQEDRLELLEVTRGEIAAAARKHLVAARVYERGDLGHALVLVLVVRRLGR